MKTCPASGRACGLDECKPTTHCWLRDSGVVRPAAEVVPLRPAQVPPLGGSRADSPMFGFADPKDAA
jgi:hypothetical protein